MPPPTLDHGSADCGRVTWATWPPSRVTRLKVVLPAPASSETAINDRLGDAAAVTGGGLCAAPPADEAECDAGGLEHAPSPTTRAIRGREFLMSVSLRRAFCTGRCREGGICRKSVYRRHALTRSWSKE